MTQDIDLKAIEKKILKTAHQHGLFDIIVGLIYTGMAFGPIFREALPEPYRYFLWPLILICIGCIILFFLFIYVVKPRIGFVKPGPKLKSIGKKLLIITLAQSIFTLIIFLLPFFGIASGVRVEGITFILIIGLVFIVFPFITMAYLLKFPRLYLIGLLIWTGIFINEIINHSIDYRIRWLLSYGITGTVILFIGIVIFIRFLKRYPMPKEEVLNNE
ncbi:MAG: hypothetical protein ACFFFB_10025 [Candidatus Heimdallarchaeota archaeon]